MTTRPEIDRLLTDVVQVLNLDDDPDLRDFVHEQLHSAYNAGASSVIGDRLTPLALVNRFIKRRPINFDDSMGTTPGEHIVEFETWRRTANARKHEGT